MHYFVYGLLQSTLVQICQTGFRLYRTQELCESRGGRPELLVPNSLYGLCGRKATLNLNFQGFRAQELCESRGGRPGFPVPNSLCGIYGSRATLNFNVGLGEAGCSDRVLCLCF